MNRTTSRVPLQNRPQIRSAFSRTLILVCLIAFGVAGCSRRTLIRIDGSSTVFPITAAVAEEFRHENDAVNVAVGFSGTGGGFKKFCNHETDISNASRSVKKVEIEKCAGNGVEFMELTIAYDGLAVVVHPSNTFVKQVTVDQLNAIYASDTSVRTWQDVNPEWPAAKIEIYAPGADSGTHDYFVEAILGKKKRIRQDAAFNEDDNALIYGISRDNYAIGFFGVAYFEENKDKLRALPVVNPNTGEAVLPESNEVRTGNYAPLSRDMYLYVNIASLQTPEVRQFLDFYLNNAAQLSREVGYIALPEEMYAEARSKVKAAVARQSAGVHRASF